MLNDTFNKETTPNDTDLKQVQEVSVYERVEVYLPTQREDKIDNEFEAHVTGVQEEAKQRGISKRDLFLLEINTMAVRGSLRGYGSIFSALCGLTTLSGKDIQLSDGSKIALGRVSDFTKRPESTELMTNVVYPYIIKPSEMVE